MHEDRFHNTGIRLAQSDRFVRSRPRRLLARGECDPGARRDWCLAAGWRARGPGRLASNFRDQVRQDLANLVIALAAADAAPVDVASLTALATATDERPAIFAEELAVPLGAKPWRACTLIPDATSGARRDAVRRSRAHRMCARPSSDAGAVVTESTYAPGRCRAEARIAPKLVRQTHRMPLKLYL